MIYLFGDSFVEAEDARNLSVRDHKRWYDIMSEKMDEKHSNSGKCGEGPVSTMDKFLTRFESGWYDKGDKFVFVLSSPYRIPWKWKCHNKKYVDNDNHYSVPSTIFQDFFSESDDKDLEMDEYQKFTLKSFYDCMHDEMTLLNIKNICTLKHISEMYEHPMVVFTAFDINTAPMKRRTGKPFNDKAYMLDRLNSELFYHYPTPLYEHSYREWINEMDLNEGMLNHFSERNHEIIANILCNHFTGTNYTTEFHERFIVSDVNRRNRNNNDPEKFVDFIYE